MLSSIGEVAKRTRCNIETIRYYERIELIPAPARTEGGHRVYDAASIDRLRFVRRCRELGFPLPEIRALLGLVDGGDYTCAEVKALTLAQRDTVRAKLADLGRIERVLDEMAAQCGGGTVPDCPIIATLFHRG